MLQTASLLFHTGDVNVGEKAALAAKRTLPATIDVNQKPPTKRNPMSLAIGARVIERLLPFLGRVAKTSPAHWAKLTNELKSKGVAAADTAAGIVAYARQNPLNASLVFATIASAGISVADLFSSEDKADTAVRKTAITLDQLTVGAQTHVDQLVANNAAASENVKPGAADREVELRLLQEICSWAKGHFGSARAALEGHQKLQAFVEIPYADLETGFRLLK